MMQILYPVLGIRPRRYQLNHFSTAHIIFEAETHPRGMIVFARPRMNIRPLPSQSTVSVSRWLESTRMSHKRRQEDRYSASYASGR